MGKRKHWALCVGSLISLVLDLNVSAASSSTPVEQILATKKGLVQSIRFVRVSDGEILYELEPNKALNPASVTKLITAAAALKRYGPAHAFRTPILFTGQRQGRKITGDIIAVGSGDPYLVSEKIWQLTADIRNQGIAEIAGDLVVDNSLFSGIERDEMRHDGTRASDNAYDAPVSAFAINFNTVAIAVAPGQRRGDAAFVAFDPYPIPGLRILGSVATGAAGTGKSVSLVRKSNDKGDVLIISGKMGADEEQTKIYRSITDPVMTSGGTLMSFLKNAGIAVRGKVRTGTAPASAKLLALIEGYPLRMTVQGLNVFSNNFMADMLVKRLGASFPKNGAPEAPGSGTYPNGIAVLQAFLAETLGRGHGSDTKLLNGSGLTEHNLTNAATVTAVLRAAAQDLSYFPDFLASLPASGVEGTMKDRLGGKQAKTDVGTGFFRAKTGTLTEPHAVSAIAGYYFSDRHGLVAFAIIQNGTPGNAMTVVDLRNVQDRALVAASQNL